MFIPARLFPVLLVTGVSIFFRLGILCVSAEDESIPPPPPQKAVDYRNPPREYETVKTGEWVIEVEKQLRDNELELSERAVKRLEEKLEKAFQALPESSHALLKSHKFFLMYGPKATNDGRDNGLEYYQKHAPQYYKHIDPRWGGCITVYCAENYVQISDLWALKVIIHELAHAYHLEQWPENQVDIRQAWKNALSLGFYSNVKDDGGKTIDKAYAAVNQLEYFAELSCMYFVGCNYQPFNRAELKTYDPAGYDMIEKMWGIQEAGKMPHGVGSALP